MRIITTTKAIIALKKEICAYYSNKNKLLVTSIYCIKMQLAPHMLVLVALLKYLKRRYKVLTIEFVY